MKHITTVILLINGLLLTSAVQSQNQQNGSKKRQFGAPNSVRNQGQTKGQQDRKTVRQPLSSKLAGSNNQQGQAKKPKQKPQGKQTGMTKAKKGEYIVKCLKLDKEQAQKLRAAHQSMVATHKGLRGNKDLSAEEKKQAHHDAHKKHLEGLAEFLSEEQLAKLKEIHRKNAKPQQNNKKPKPGERKAKALGLSKEQVSKLRRVREFAIKKIGGILKNKELSKEQKHEQIKEVHVTFRARRNEILTEEQQAKLKELWAAAKARREEQAAKSGKESSGRPKSHLVRTAQKRSENQNKQRGAQNEQHSKNSNQAFGRQQNHQQQGRPQRRPQQSGRDSKGRLELAGGRKNTNTQAASKLYGALVAGTGGAADMEKLAKEAKAQGSQHEKLAKKAEAEGNEEEAAELSELAAGYYHNAGIFSQLAEMKRQGAENRGNMDWTKYRALLSQLGSAKAEVGGISSQQGGNQEQGRPQRRPQGGGEEKGRPQRRPQGGNQEQSRPQRRPQTQNR